MLHLTKIAFACASLDVLHERLEGRASGGETSITTRFRPKRADELVGGSLFWILNHRIVARQTVLGFVEAPERRCLIRLDRRLVPVIGRTKRAHQGWRYLEADDAPPDLIDPSADPTGIAALPPHIVADLSALALI